jgi:hypothetical protein
MRLGSPVVIELPLHPDEEMAGGGTLISGLKPAPPASVASSGMAPSLNEVSPGAGDDDAGMPGVAGGPDPTWLQPADIIDVPNVAGAGVAVGNSGIPNWVVAPDPNGGITGVPNAGAEERNGVAEVIVAAIPGVALAIPGKGHVVRVPIAPACAWLMAPRLSWMVPKAEPMAPGRAASRCPAIIPGEGSPWATHGPPAISATVAATSRPRPINPLSGGDACLLPASRTMVR